MSEAHGMSHRFSLRVYYEDTDAGGVVYYANYLSFFERGRTEMLRQIGMDHQTLKARHGLIFAVRRCSVEYHAPARLDDVLEIQTEIAALGASLLDMRQFIRHEERLLTTAQIAVAAVGSEGRAKRMPDALRRLILPFVQPPVAAGTEA